VNVGKTLFARVMECVPWDRLLATQLELVTPVLQVVQRLATRHLLAAAGLVADEGHGRAVTLVQRFGFTAHLNIHLGPAGGLLWEWPQVHQPWMTFSLPAGVYATSVLKAILHTTEPDRHTGSEAGAVD